MNLRPFKSIFLCKSDISLRNPGSRGKPARLKRGDKVEITSWSGVPSIFNQDLCRQIGFDRYGKGKLGVDRWVLSKEDFLNYFEQES